MIEEETDVAPGALAKYDAVIDVRSPAEFAEDRLPGAINLPVLSNEERAEVGAIYVQESRFRARRIGASYVAANVARHLVETLAAAPPGYRPLLYCWRGGMRSNAMATILSQIGWRVGVLKGGYKTWRRHVIAALRIGDLPLKVILLDGQTGTAKSAILEELARLDVQTLDLEAIAAHRGSVFGGLAARPQPSQKLFESEITAALAQFDRAKPIIIEAESNRIGERQLPHGLWRAMSAAPRIEIRADPAARARYLTEAYADIIAAPAAVMEAIARLAPFHAKERIEAWTDMAGARAYAALAESLMRAHYDPLYDRGRKRRGDNPLAVIRLDVVDADAIACAARDIAAIAAP